MRFSIIVPIYRVEKYLSQCVDSVICQSYSDFELILVDDGSPDSCPLICDEYALADNRIKVIHKPNGGLSDARNAGLEVASGDYVIFLDSDDWWENSRALEIISDVIDKNGAEIILFGIEKFNMSTREFFDIRIPSFSGAISGLDSVISGIYRACACDKVVKRELIESSGLRFRKGQLSEDIEWCIHLLHIGRAIAVLPELIYVYRQNDQSISHNVKRKNIEDILSVIGNYTKGEYADDDAVMNFAALQYVLLLATSARVPSKDIADLLAEMKKLTYLLDYTGTKRVRMARLFKPLGVRGIRFLMGLYQKLKG